MTCGPGLVGALLVGVETAKSLAFSLGKPLVGVNHLAGHLAAVFSATTRHRRLPHLALLVSGGHTALIRVDGPGRTSLLGATRDDAAGEAFDKVGKLLGLGYPGGVAIDRLAATGNPRAVELPRALPARDDLDFSFSGLKTAVFDPLGRRPGVRTGDRAGRLLRQLSVRGGRRAGPQVAARAGPRRARGAGGLRRRGGQPGSAQCAGRGGAREDGFGLFIPPPKRCTDNAAMIAAAGQRGSFLRGETLRSGPAPWTPGCRY